MTRGEGIFCGLKVSAGASVFVPCSVEIQVEGDLTFFLASTNRSVQ